MAIHHAPLPPSGAAHRPPVWAWRIFPASLQPFRERLEAMLQGAVPLERAETCVLSNRSTQCAWIREGGLELDVLCQVDGQELERWVTLPPVPFPLEAMHLPRVFETWGLPLPGLERATYTLEQFLEELVAPFPDLAAVAIRRSSLSLDVHGVLGEMATLMANDVPLATLELEHESPGVLRETLCWLGLEGRPSISQAEGIRRALHLPGAAACLRRPGSAHDRPPSIP